MAIQQMLLGGGKVKKTYLDEVFSNYLYKGTGSAVAVNNGIDLSGEGGLVWIKSRTDNHYHNLIDTARGATKSIFSNHSMGEDTGTNGYMTSFNNNGFTTGTYNNVTKSDQDFTSWSFRKAPGFFDVVTWTGNGTARTISHSLNCIPGLILIKQYGSSTDWVVYHRNMHSSPEEYFAYFNESNAATNSPSGIWNDTAPTASVFSIGTNGLVNESSGEYIAYVFAGGESTAATARSVDMDGTGDYINTTSSSSDFTMGTGDFTVECWVKWDGGAKGIFQISPTSGGIQGQPGFTDTMCLWIDSDSKFNYQAGGTKVAPIKIQKEQWTHVAYVRNSGTTSLYVNGTLAKSDAHTTDLDGTYIGIGGYWDTGYLWDGKISNFRVVKGTAVYTSSFRPPTEPLTNISGTVLLCCNDSSVTGSTVTPVTLNSQGDPTASTDSPFDDPAGFKFGENKDQNIIYTKSYTGNGSTTGPEIYVGWEPQWILVKCAENSEAWVLWDSMRGIVDGGNDPFFEVNDSAAENTFQNWITLTPTGFKLITANNQVNQNNKDYIVTCIRRPDGYVGKPIETGTDAFTIDLVGVNSGDPSWVSDFPVDMQFIKDRSGTTYNFFLSTRLTQGKYLSTTSNAVEGSNAVYAHDYSTGFGNYSAAASDNITSFMWRRHKGFDVVAYKGTEIAGQGIAHSLSVVPEMMWVKRRSGSAEGWAVYHKGLNGGSSPEDWNLKLDEEAVEEDTDSRWNDTAPTSSHFFLGTSGRVNTEDEDYLAMLFASVPGVSSVGYYSGNDSGQTITTGFQPRFVIIKQRSNAESWYMFDTVRGWSQNNQDWFLRLDGPYAQSDHVNDRPDDIGHPVSTGFYLKGESGSDLNVTNKTGRNYVYYAHA